MRLVTLHKLLYRAERYPRGVVIEVSDAAGERLLARGLVVRPEAAPEALERVQRAEAREREECERADREQRQALKVYRLVLAPNPRTHEVGASESST